jgi:hypothetical protein
MLAKELRDAKLQRVRKATAEGAILKRHVLSGE